MTRVLVRVLVVFAAALLGGCSSSPAAGGAASQRGDPTPDLRAKAAIADCPAPGQPATPAAGGRLLPDAELPCLAEGPDVPLRGLTGTPTVLNLWATWCTPCRKELPAFQKAFEAADPRQLRILGVVTEDPGVSRPLSFAADTGLHLPSIVDDKGVVARELGARSLPATVLLGRDGLVVHVYSGPPLTYDALRALVTQHLHVRLDG